MQSHPTNASPRSITRNYVAHPSEALSLNACGVRCIMHLGRHGGGWEAFDADVEEGHLSTLLCHYGNIAYRTGRKLHIDPKTEGFVDDPEANSFVKRTYREPYAIPETV